MSIFSDKEANIVLRNRNFKFFLAGRFLITITVQMQFIIVASLVYSITRDPLSLGLIGLSEVIPFIFTALFSGWIADKYSKKKIIQWSSLLYVLCALALFTIAIQATDHPSQNTVYCIYAVIFITGIARSFIYPSLVAIMAQIVSKEHYVYSSSWNSLFWHTALVIGPPLGGLIYDLTNASIALAIVLFFSIFTFIVYSQIDNIKTERKVSQNSKIQEVLIGLKFVFNNQIVLGALSLDMFAVLFGGAVSMLPVFTSEILHVGSVGFGILRASPALGAVIMSFYLAYHPPKTNTGIKLLLAVAGFGLSIICFAISKNFYLSFALLFLSGLFDSIGVVIRHTIIQMYTPDEMRGRVASVNSIFIGSSNEIGAFESGVTARWLGLIPSVMVGGGITILIAISSYYIAPSLRKLNFKK